MTDISTEYIEQILDNWGNAYRGGWPKVGYPSQTVEQAMRGGIVGGALSYVPEDAEKAEYIICRMTKNDRYILECRYIKRWSGHSEGWRKSVQTFYNRLEAAQKRFSDEWRNILIA